MARTKKLYGDGATSPAEADVMSQLMGYSEPTGPVAPNSLIQALRSASADANPGIKFYDAPQRSGSLDFTPRRSGNVNNPGVFTMLSSGSGGGTVLTPGAGGGADGSTGGTGGTGGGSGGSGGSAGGGAAGSAGGSDSGPGVGGSTSWNLNSGNSSGGGYYRGDEYGQTLADMASVPWWMPGGLVMRAASDFLASKNDGYSALSGKNGYADARDAANKGLGWGNAEPRGNLAIDNSILDSKDARIASDNAITDSINRWFDENPDASHAQIYDAMKANGITSEQLSAAKKWSVADINAAIDALNQPSSSGTTDQWDGASDFLSDSPEVEEAINSDSFNTSLLTNPSSYSSSSSTSGSSESSGTATGGSVLSSGNTDASGGGDRGTRGGMATGGKVTKGHLRGPDPKGPDDGYVALDVGEFVITKEATKKLGPEVIELLERLNASDKKRFNR